VTITAMTRRVIIVGKKTKEEKEAKAARKAAKAARIAELEQEQESSRTLPISETDGAPIDVGEMEVTGEVLGDEIISDFLEPETEPETELETATEISRPKRSKAAPKTASRQVEEALSDEIPEVAHQEDMGEDNFVKHLLNRHPEILNGQTKLKTGAPLRPYIGLHLRTHNAGVMENKHTHPDEPWDDSNQ
jgi:hypothetical protein